MRDIIGYGNFLWQNIKPSNALRHKLYKKYGFRCCISPQYYIPGLALPLALHGYVLDNGAYINFKKGLLFDADKYIKMVEAWGQGADWIVIPDVVGNAELTLSISWAWISRLVRLGFKNKLMFVYQDGMTAADLHPYVGQGIGIFIGGSTEAKLSNMSWIAELCRKYDVICHVGRVNTKNRVELCIQSGCTSFDGSGWTQFPSASFKYIRDIENNNQMSLFSYSKRTTHLVSLEDRCKALGVSVGQVLQYWNDIKQVDTVID